MKTNLPIRRTRSGQTLIELVAATTMMAIAIVPGLELMRDGVRVSRELEAASAMTTLCVSKLEEHLADSAAAWTTTTTSGNFASEGYASLRYSVTRSDEASDGGITNRLMALSVTVWEDADGDTTLDAEESQVTFSTKVARIASYENEASGT
ncbi:MAG: hypothetical protein DWQ31_06160 [Planctomycetota bacterium]|nr:MAG: hypothetical protein DWQ31_06160 [Planctomycetota bacterium]REJ98591.1 MAG: hypothetical protein DWQ35_00915 [Planctomycetota bacterium]